MFGSLLSFMKYMSHKRTTSAWLLKSQGRRLKWLSYSVQEIYEELLNQMHKSTHSLAVMKNTTMTASHDIFEMLTFFAADIFVRVRQLVCLLQTIPTFFTVFYCLLLRYFFYFYCYYYFTIIFGQCFRLLIPRPQDFYWGVLIWDTVYCIFYMYCIFYNIFYFFVLCHKKYFPLGINKGILILVMVGVY